MYIFKLLFLIFNGYKSHNIFFSTGVPKPLPPSISDLKFRVQIKRSLSFKILESKFHQIQRKKFKLNKQISDDTVFRRDFISHFYCVPSPSFWKKGETRWNEFVEVVRYHFTFMFCFAFFCKSLEMRIFRLAVMKLNTFQML